MKTKLYLGQLSAIDGAFKHLLVNESKLLAYVDTLKEPRALTYRCGRALLKAALVHNNLIDSNKCLPHISYNSLGKPILDLPRYYFNLSHSHQMMALALGDHEMGVDIELIDNNRLKPPLLKRVLSPLELDLFYFSAHQAAFFTQQWTVRECLVKVMGKSIFTMESLKIDASSHHISAHGYPQGIIACFALGNDKINQNTDSLFLLPPGLDASFQVAIFLQLAYASYESLDQAVVEHLELWLPDYGFRQVKIKPQVIFTVN